MKWATAENLGTVRPASMWLIRRFVDPQAEFLFLPKDRVLAEAAAAGARTFHLKDAGDYPVTDERSSFSAVMDRHELRGRDAALDLMAQILEKTPPGAAPPREMPGLRAIIHGFQDSIPDDREKLVHLLPMYEALYHYCRRRVAGRD